MRIKPVVCVVAGKPGFSPSPRFDGLDACMVVVGPDVQPGGSVEDEPAAEPPVEEVKTKAEIKGGGNGPKRQTKDKFRANLCQGLKDGSLELLARDAETPSVAEKVHMDPLPQDGEGGKARQSTKDKFRSNLSKGLKDGSLESVARDAGNPSVAKIKDGGGGKARLTTKDKFRANLSQGLKDGSLESMAKAAENPSVAARLDAAAAIDSSTAVSGRSPSSGGGGGEAVPSVCFRMTVGNISFRGDAMLQKLFEDKFREALASEAGAGVLPEHVAVKLSFDSGVVVVDANITPPGGVTIDAIRLRSHLSASTTIAETVVQKISTVQGIAAALLGDIRVSNISTMQMQQVVVQDVPPPLAALAADPAPASLVGGAMKV
jgi:hypothetical protein